MSRGKNKLAALTVKNAGEGKLFDGGGLTLVKTSKDAWKWVFRYSFAGRRPEMGLGTWPTVSLSDARKERDKWQAEIREGRDPISARNIALAEAKDALDREDPTFEELAEIVFEAKKAELRGDGERGRWMSPVRVHMFPKIGKKRGSQIHSEDIKAALQPIWKTKTETSRKCITRTRMIFADGHAMGYDIDPAVVDQAKAKLGKVRKPKTQRITSTPWQDVPELYQRLRTDTSAGRALRFLILTCVRSDPVVGCKFSEIDGNVWTMPADRVKATESQADDFRVPLSAEALALVEKCREFAISDYLFPGQRGGGKRSLSNNAMLSVLNDMNEPGRPHGFRSSFRTWATETRAVPWDVAEMILQHNFKTDVQAAYDRSDLFEERAIAMQKWADFVTGQEAKVIPLRGAK